MMKTNTLYISGLDPSIDESALKKEFSKCVQIDLERVTVICDKQTRVSKGFAYVVCKNHDDATTAMKEMDGRIVADKPIKVKYSFSETPEWVSVLESRGALNENSPGRGSGYSGTYRGNRGRGDFDHRGRGDFGSRGRSNFGSRGRGEFNSRGPGEFSARGHGDFSTRGRDDFGSRGRDFNSRGHGGSDRRGHSDFRQGRRGGYVEERRSDSFQSRSGYGTRGDSVRGRGMSSGRGTHSTSQVQDSGYLGYGGRDDAEMNREADPNSMRRRNPAEFYEDPYARRPSANEERKRMRDNEFDVTGSMSQGYERNSDRYIQESSRESRGAYASEGRPGAFTGRNDATGYRSSNKISSYGNLEPRYGEQSREAVGRLPYKRDIAEQARDAAGYRQPMRDPLSRSSYNGIPEEPRQSSQYVGDYAQSSERHGEDTVVGRQPRFSERSGFYDEQLVDDPYGRHESRSGGCSLVGRVPRDFYRDVSEMPTTQRRMAPEGYGQGGRYTDGHRQLPDLSRTYVPY